MSTALKQPVFFLSHGGGPSFFMEGVGLFSQIDKKSKSKEFLSNLSQYIKVKPTAILVISAHWEESVFTVGYQSKGTSLLYDYYGFPKETYAPYLTYAAPTDLQIADKIYETLKSAGIKCAKSDRPFDHGVFIPLKLVYPNADIPIIQVSLQKDLNIQEHINFGKALAPLREQGIVIIGSGQATHNLGEIRNVYSSTSEIKPAKWANDFVQWVDNTLNKINLKKYDEAENDLKDILLKAPNAQRAHPRTEHLVPLFVSFGAAIGNNSNSDSQNISYRRIYSEIAVESMSLDSYMFE